MRKHNIENIIWREVVWQRQFETTAVWEAFSHLAALSPRGAVLSCGHYRSRPDLFTDL